LPLDVDGLIISACFRLVAMLVLKTFKFGFIQFADRSRISTLQIGLVGEAAAGTQFVLQDERIIAFLPRSFAERRHVSMSLFKQFPLSNVGEGMLIEFRAESFNTFNHLHFQGPDTTVGSSTFGLIACTVNSPRPLQPALKLYFCIWGLRPLAMAEGFLACYCSRVGTTLRAIFLSSISGRRQVRWRRL
jgi:hypothetical protein